MNRRRWAGALVLAACLATAAAQEPSPAPADATAGKWVGHVVPPYPAGWSQHSGASIGSADAPGGVCHHSIAVISDAQSGMRMILGLAGVKHFGKEPLWRIVAALEPDALFDRKLDAVHGVCQWRGIDDAAVVAIVRYQEREWLPAREAWRFDHAAARMVPLRAAEVRCLNEGYTG